MVSVFDPRFKVKGSIQWIEVTYSKIIEPVSQITLSTDQFFLPKHIVAPKTRIGDPDLSFFDGRFFFLGKGRQTDN
jgi:hypothetical protein